MCKVATIGEQIQAARKDKGMTQEMLAEIMNVSRQAVSHWETNRTMPDAETLIRLSKTLEYSFGMISPDQTPVTASEDKQEDATPMSKHYTKKQRRRDDRIVLFIYGLIVVAFLSVIFSAWWVVFRTTRYRATQG